MLRRRKVLSKVAAKAEGPYEVVRTSGMYRQRITIKPLDSLVGPKRKAEQQTVTVHASQLVPFKPPTVTAGGIEAEGEQQPLEEVAAIPPVTEETMPNEVDDDAGPSLPRASKRGRVIRGPARLNL